MCDYSLHCFLTRDAKAKDELVLSHFPGTSSKGLAEEGKPNVAVCMRPGTELVFETNVRYDQRWIFLSKDAGYNVAKFVQINQGRDQQHHDAIEFPNGKVVSLQRLVVGQKVTVLQLPIKGDQKASASGTTTADQREHART